MLDFAYFCKERMRFQEVIGDTRYSPEQVAKGFRGLLEVYLGIHRNPDVTDEDKLKAEISMQAACYEHDRRLAYRLVIDK